MVYVNCIENAKNLVVYFPGDVQQLRAVIDPAHGEYSYEDTATYLRQSFPQSNIFIIQPHTMYQNTYSCFEHFTTCNTVGAVAQCTGIFEQICHVLDTPQQACAYLLQLVQDVQSKLPLEYVFVESWILVGFSKGAVVLNQLVEEGVEELWCKVKGIVWLDPGNGSLPQILPSPHRLRVSIPIVLKSTPYQRNAPSRPWIALEIDAFVNQLNLAQISFVYENAFEDQPGSLDLHFALLREPIKFPKV